jgi:hypothetical protein
MASRLFLVLLLGLAPACTPLNETTSEPDPPADGPGASPGEGPPRSDGSAPAVDAPLFVRGPFGRDGSAAVADAPTKGGPTAPPTTGGAVDAGNSVIPVASSDPAAVKECTDLEIAGCARTARCFPQIFKERYGDMATCLTKASLACPNEPAVPGTTTMAPQIAACLTARQNQTCADFLANVVPPECAYRGIRGQGSVCTDGRQCTTGSCSFSGDVCGKCGNLVQAGAPCLGNFQCASGLVCGPGINLCVSLARMGEPCGTRAFCGYGLYCSAGTCAPELAGGATCDPSVPSCSVAADLECDPATMKCVSHVYGNKGASCDGRVNDCYTGGACLSSASNPSAGICSELPKQGEQCDPQNLPCQEPWSCLQASKTTFICDLGVQVDPNSCQP